MDLLKPYEQLFKNAMGDAADSFVKKVILWKRRVMPKNRFGEDVETPTEDIEIEVLINYNYMRSWPITFQSETGELDRQSMQVIFSKNALKQGGYLTPDGYFDYSPGMDRFVIDGLVHKCVGDTAVSQFREDDLWFTIIMKREETPTGDFR